MQEEDIRPAKLKAVSDKLFREDAKRLLQYQESFVEVPCPACGFTDKKIHFEKAGYMFRQCRKCQTIYISPRPTPNLLTHYYTTAKYYKYWMKNIFPISRQARIANIYRPRVRMLQQIIKKYKIPTNTLVDIGAGSGDFGKEINSHRIFDQIILVEPGEIQIMSTSTLKVINKVFEDVIILRDIQVITCFETLEHLFSPLVFLTLVYKKLVNKGLLMFSTVNHQGFDILVLGKKSEYLIGPDHLNIFTFDSIKFLLAKIGFRQIEITTPGQLDVDLIVTAHKNKLINLKTHPFLYHLIIEKGDVYRKPFQRFLQQQKLSSHMLVIAQK